MQGQILISPYTHNPLQLGVLTCYFFAQNIHLFCSLLSAVLRAQSQSDYCPYFIEKYLKSNTHKNRNTLTHAQFSLVTFSFEEDFCIRNLKCFWSYSMSPDD